MIDYELTFVGQLIWTPNEEGDPGDREQELEDVFDLTTEELLKLPEAIDPIVAGSITTGLMEITLTVAAERLGEATDAADTLVRTALHAAGVSTKDWPADGSELFVNFAKVTIDDPEADDATCDDLIDA